MSFKEFMKHLQHKKEMAAGKTESTMSIFNEQAESATTIVDNEKYHVSAIDGNARVDMEGKSVCLDFKMAVAFNKNDRSMVMLEFIDGDRDEVIRTVMDRDQVAGIVDVLQKAMGHLT